MKTASENQNVAIGPDDGLEQYLGKYIAVVASQSSYVGKLVGVDAKHIKLSDVHVSKFRYGFTDIAANDYQSLPNYVYVSLRHIESFTQAPQR